MSLSGQIAVVTGASRGIGRGIALQLGEAGATVYVTGRKPKDSDAAKFTGLPQLEKTAEEINNRGGRGIAVHVDHGNMDEVKDLFEKVDRENNGRLDILVNNAFSAVQTIIDNMGKKFFECPPEMWDTVNNVGLRNHYFCSVYGARVMHNNHKGLIVNVSSPGGIKYFFNVPYGVGKQAMDRMAADCAIELEKSNVCVVSLWPGAVKTELIHENYGPEEGKTHTGVLPDMMKTGESIEYPGKAVVALANDPKRMKKTGRILITGDLASEYGFVDIDGSVPANLRSVSTLLDRSGFKKTASWIPKFIKVPGSLLWAATGRL